MKPPIPANTILQGDGLSLMQNLPDHSVDLVLCDLPYGITHNKWEHPLPLEDLWKEYRRIVKPAGYVILTGQGLFTSTLIESNRRQFSHKLVWFKHKARGFLNANRMPLKQHEDILVFRMGKKAPYHPQYTFGHAPYTDKYFSSASSNYGQYRKNPVDNHNDGRRYPIDVISISISGMDKPTIHPTQKPVEMGRYLIRQYSDPGALVLDNCCGSGSFPAAAFLEKRRYLGMEANEQYVTASRLRLQNIRESFLSL